MTLKDLMNSGAGDAAISGFTYEYDGNGNRTSQIETRQGFSESTTYNYDGLDRLESFTVANGADTTVTEYTFEGYNRASETVRRNGSTVAYKSYSYDESDWLLNVQISDDGGNRSISYTYDKNGNTVRKTDSAGTDPLLYDYDASNRLVRAMRGSTLLGLYDYDADGLRIRHRNGDRGDVDYFYDGRAVIEERRNGGLLAHYRYAGKPLSLLSAGELQYYHFDALGSTVNLTNAAGTQQAGYFLDPWGRIEDQEGDSVNRQIFTGQERDENTGLIYFGARYYDPDTARFITEDSYLGEPGTPPSLNRYLYAYSNPTVYIDLFGYYSWKEFRKDAWKVVKKIADPIGAVDLTIKGLGYVSKGLEYLERKTDENYEKQIEAVGDIQLVKDSLAVKATMDKTVLSVVKGLVDTPKNLREQGDTFVEDPQLKNIPILGPQGQAIGESYAKAYENPNLVNISEAIGQTAFGLGTAFGGVGAARGLGVKGTYQAPKPTMGFTKESVSGEPVVEVGQMETIGSSQKLSPTNYPNPDPPMDLPPVRYEPSTVEEVVRMRQGKGPRTKAEYGTENIEAHHRQQKPISKDGVMDEITEQVHRRDGAHTRHSKTSELSPKERAKEIREHFTERGKEYILPGEGI